MVWGRGAACCAPTFIPAAFLTQLQVAFIPAASCPRSRVAPNHITRKNGRYPRQIGYAPPPGDHSMSGWKDRGIPASACTGGRSGCVAMTIPVLARTSLPSVRALTFFGRVRTAEMILNRFGEIARQCWTSIPSHFPHVRIDAFVVMPDHVHGILLFGARYPRTAAIGRIGPGSLGAVVRSFTSAVASRINALRGARVGGIWQRNYFDQVIRNRDDLNRVRRYIRDNPARWERNRT